MPPWWKPSIALHDIHPLPAPAEGEVTVDVIAAGLHPVVKLLAGGTHYGSTRELPFIAGVDGVGRLADGSLVYFGVTRKPFGTFAERAVTSRGMCLPLPAGLDPVTAAAMGAAGVSTITAAQWLFVRLRGLTENAQFRRGNPCLSSYDE